MGIMKFNRFIWLLIFVLGCAATKETVEEKPPVDGKSVYDESFDPMSLEDDDIVIGPERIEANPVTEQGSSNVITSDVKEREVNGFRVQILATNNIETASLVEQEATDRFEKLGHKTYLLFEAPLYKIRLGDCVNRSEAESLREIALNFGYSGAFIVKTKVLTER